MTQFIPMKIIEGAIGNPYHNEQSQYPVVFGIKVARHRDNRTILYIRQTLHTRDIIEYPSNINMVDLADHIDIEITKWHPIAVNIDYGVMGQGLIDVLHNLGHHNVYRIVSGAKARRPMLYANKRAEMWHLMKEWLTMGGSIPDDTELKKSLNAPKYFFNKARLQLEQTRKIKPILSKGNGLSLTFAMPF